MNWDSGTQQLFQQFSIAVPVTGSNVCKLPLMNLSIEIQWRTQKDRQRCALLLLRCWLSFQFFPHKFFSHLIAQIYPLLPVFPISQIPEISGLMSGLDFRALYLRDHKHKIYSTMIIFMMSKKESISPKNQLFQSIHRSFNKSTSL